VSRPARACVKRKLFAHTLGERQESTRGAPRRRRALIEPRSCSGYRGVRVVGRIGLAAEQAVFHVCVSLSGRMAASVVRNSIPQSSRFWAGVMAS
jgi:hypothetical protein